MLLALFGIGNDTLNLVVNLLVLSLVVVYFALVAWTYFDARRRMDDPVLVASSVGASFVFPFIGTVIYSILRPPDFLEDAHEREVEIRAAELRVRQLTEQSCPKCDYPIEKTFLRCPNCRSRLKDPCAKCGKPVDPRWALCPYCEAAIGRPAPERRAPRPEKREAREPREGREKPREGKPSRESKSRGEGRPSREQRRAATAERSGSKPQKRSERRKSGESSPQRPPARSGSGSGSGDDGKSVGDGKGEPSDAKREAGSGASSGEERSRSAPTS